jgi:hypothetical protein
VAVQCTVHPVLSEDSGNAENHQGDAEDNQDNAKDNQGDAENH